VAAGPATVPACRPARLVPDPGRPATESRRLGLGLGLGRPATDPRRSGLGRSGLGRPGRPVPVPHRPATEPRRPGLDRSDSGRLGPVDRAGLEAWTCSWEPPVLNVLE
jgi:hypothetical protein